MLTGVKQENKLVALFCNIRNKSLLCIKIEPMYPNYVKQNDDI